MAKLGVDTQTTPPGEIPPLCSGAIDAAEWIGPWNDRAFSLYKVAKFYYVPAFHEPGPGLEIIVNKASWQKLSPDLQTIVETAPPPRPTRPMPISSTTMSRRSSPC